MPNVLVPLPHCPRHQLTTVYRTPGTPEQAFCGAWYVCPIPRCAFTHLMASTALLAFLLRQQPG